MDLNKPKLKFVCEFENMTQELKDKYWKSVDEAKLHFYDMEKFGKKLSKENFLTYLVSRMCNYGILILEN